ncbi:MAG TPA: sugar phosphate isomerase/epimerase [Pyrinomonadaceae bacterium]|nr:sugar phosphate isomerase/epimerase [Pyrinomonadaceae bacterium]
MQIALNGATTMQADLAADFQAAKAAGFDYVEIWAEKLVTFLHHRTSLELKDLIAKTVPPLSINSIEHITFSTPFTWDAIKKQCAELSDIAARLDCPYLVVVPSPLPNSGVTRSEVIAESVRVLRELCDIAARSNTSLAFEFIGQSDCSVPTLDLAHEIVITANRPNLGLVIDSFHFYAGGSTIEMVEALDPELIYIFHINDAENLPREQLQDSHRLLPGLGILPLRELLAAFRRIGYDKVASVEIFRPEYWERDPFELAKEARIATERVLQAKPND